MFDKLPGLGGGGEADEAEQSGDSSASDGEATDAERPADLTPAEFRERAETLAGRSDVPTLDFTVDSLESLDDLASGPATPVDDEIAYGSYLGETLVRAFDGEWVDVDGWEVAVALPDDRTTVAVFDAARMSIANDPVFSKVATRLEANGARPAPSTDDEAGDIDGEDDSTDAEAAATDGEADATDAESATTPATQAVDEDGDETAADAASGDDDEGPGEAATETETGGEGGDVDDGTDDTEDELDDGDDVDDVGVTGVDEEDETDAERDATVDDGNDARDGAPLPDEPSSEDDESTPDGDDVEGDDPGLTVDETGGDDTTEGESTEGESIEDDADADDTDEDDADEEEPTETGTSEEADSEDDAGEPRESVDDGAGVAQPNEDEVASGDGVETGDVTDADETTSDDGAETAADDVDDSDIQPAATGDSPSDGTAASEAEPDDVGAVEDGEVDDGEVDDDETADSEQTDETGRGDDDVVLDDVSTERDAPAEDDGDTQPVTDASERVDDDSLDRVDDSAGEGPDSPADAPSPPSPDDVADDAAPGSSDGSEDSFPDESDDQQSTDEEALPPAEEGGDGEMSPEDEPVEGDETPTATAETTLSERDAVATDALGDGPVGSTGEDERVGDIDAPGEEGASDDVGATDGDEAIADDETDGDASETDDDGGPPGRYRLREAAEALSEDWPDRDLDFTPQSLPRLDAFVDDQWKGRFSRESLADRTVDHGDSTDPLTQVGAYYGEILVRWLQGEWVASDDGEGAVAVPDVGEKEERVPVFSVARECLVGQSTFAYRYDALMNRQHVDEAPVSDGRADVFDGDRDELTSPDVITQFAATAEELVDEWSTYGLDYSPRSLRRLDDLVASNYADDRFEDVSLADETDPVSLELTAHATAVGAYFSVVLVRHRDAQWRITDDVELVMDTVEGETTVDPIATAADCLRRERSFASTYQSLAE